jgi:hypothetical protein
MESTTGTCEGCGKKPRRLKRIESGQLLCVTCLRELRPPRSKHLASMANIRFLRKRGLEVGDEITKEEYHRLRLCCAIRVCEGPIGDYEPAELTDQSEDGRIRRYFTRVVGVTERNPDGVNCQDIIPYCKQFELLELTDVAVDGRNATAVIVRRASGEQIGYVEKVVAEEIIRKSQAGYRFAAFVGAVVGGTPQKPTYGVRLIIIEGDPGVADDEVQQFLGDNLATLYRSLSFARRIRHYFAQVAGVAYCNPDGVNRQDIIPSCRQLESVELIHEPENAWDPNAIMVCRVSGEQIGYLPKSLAQDVVGKSAAGYRFAACVSEVVGGKPEELTYGVTLRIVEGSPGVTDEEMQLLLAARGRSHFPPTALRER